MTVAAAARTVRAGGDAPPGAPPGGSRLRLVLSSFLMLFTELALIRFFELLHEHLTLEIFRLIELRNVLPQAEEEIQSVRRNNNEHDEHEDAF